MLRAFLLCILSWAALVVSQETSSTNNGPPISLRKQQQKNTRKILATVESLPVPDSLKPDPWCKPHNPKVNAIFTAAMKTDYTRADLRRFAGTARSGGFKGDIVIGVLPKMRDVFMEAAKQYDTITYTIDTVCEEHGRQETMCSFKGSNNQGESYSVNMIRYYLYQWWAVHYAETSYILVADFRDVLFQSNPFVYRTFEWEHPGFQIAVFQEPYPNKVIWRCAFIHASIIYLHI